MAIEFVKEVPVETRLADLERRVECLERLVATMLETCQSTS
jgi:hypothetical protein